MAEKEKESELDRLNREQGEAKKAEKPKNGEENSVLVRHRSVQQIAEEEGIKISKYPKVILAPLIFLVISSGAISAAAYYSGFGNNIIYGVTAIIWAVFITTLVVE
ncbi:MAG: hypothetical protein Q8N37_02630 [bacterium]|nr:hypothetical protein [bacterium]